MSELPDLFPGFATHKIEIDGLHFHVRSGGKGPPLLCLHGYPQTHACWHRLAPMLTSHFTVIAMDMRGYGQSSAPASDSTHVTYSKRAMARDAVGVMQKLGHDKFHVMGHDRGARVAYRLALDTPEAVDNLILLDIVPTIEQWEGMTARRAISGYHWQFLAQPEPMPETLIGANPTYYLDHTLASWTKDKNLAAFAPEALTHYRALFSDRQRIHAVCEDYRAGATFDWKADEADREAGRKIEARTLVLWGSDYLSAKSVSTLEVWQRWCTNVTGHEILSGHFLAEENPDATAEAIMAFLKAA